MRLCNRSGIPTGASTKILGYRGQDFEGVKQHLMIIPKVSEIDEPMIMYLIYIYMYYIVSYNICTCIYSPFVRMWRLFFFSTRKNRTKYRTTRSAGLHRGQGPPTRGPGPPTQPPGRPTLQLPDNKSKGGFLCCAYIFFFCVCYTNYTKVLVQYCVKS